MHRAEKLWLGFSIATLIVFLVMIGFAAVADRMIPPSHLQTIDPTKVAQTPPFDHPGVRQVGPNRYEVYIVARIFSFNPPHVELPSGATVTFYATSPDVVHGFFIANTAVNMLVVPGWVSTATHVFRKPGAYLLLCNEYCGSGHHFMFATIEVK